MIAEAEVRPTEDPERVAKALTNLFSGKQREKTEGERTYIVLEGDDILSLEGFRMIIQRDRIRAAAGAVLRRSSNANSILVFLNKQVAYVSHVSFCEPEGESPLGPIRLLIETTDPTRVIHWITGGFSERTRKQI